ncbi:MAG: molybdate ABC transporter permease subunit [Anaerolineae bacterium]
MIWEAMLLSLRVACLATALVTVVGLMIGLWLARWEFRGKSLVEALVSLPMVLPPSVVGYYLLLFLGRSGPLNVLGIRVVFTWLAAVIASAVVAIPLMIHSSRAAIAAVDPALEKAASSLGSPPWKVVWDVTLPLARRGILAGIVLAFARGLGEFGATLMVAGNIPGRTQTLPLAIYDLVQANRMTEANVAVLLMTGIAFALLFTVNRLERRTGSNAFQLRGLSRLPDTFISSGQRKQQS